MSSEFVHNHKLFSDYYLDALLPKREEWGRDYTEIRSELGELLDDKLPILPTRNEAQTETEFIQPALELLGWEFEPQLTFRRRARDERPDYALFVSRDDKAAAQSTIDSRSQPAGPEYLEKTAALGEAKYWERPLEERQADTSRDRLRDRRRSPHFQIIDYIDDADVRWGILTNGRRWRLYFAGGDTAEILYYEADLQAILESGDADAFRRFYLFFSADAFRPDDAGLCLLDHLREESQQYAEAVEERLKERVFDSVVPALAAGFVRHLRRERGIEVGPGDREKLDEVYNGTLLLLYRLFFLLYAEARELIVVGEPGGYHPKSLDHLKREIFEARRDGLSLGARSTDWWDDLTNLFDIINGGDSGLNVPRYNGGLFHPDGLGDPDIGPAARFLEENAIADRELADALLRLTRDVEAEGAFDDPRFIDFRDLGVRHLGSVYEGLLEFKLRIADAHLRKGTEDGKPVWQPADDPAEADRAPGDLYLTNDRSERKATGSYYTPDYIVRYIVENTIGPQIDRIEREHELAAEIRSDEPHRRPWNELYEAVKVGPPCRGGPAVPSSSVPDDPPAPSPSGTETSPSTPLDEVWQACATETSRREFLLNQLDGPQPDHGYDPPTRVLELKILDPALGSGHFLVGALDEITRRLVRMLNEYADSPVFGRIREDREKIVNSLASQCIEADEGKLTDENLLRRMVMKRCLYGVDLNPLAVELSKLSLWLHAFTAGAPLSFLDHHVKCGNSLIGTSLEELETRVDNAPGLFRLRMEPLERAVDHMLKVAELSDASFEDVQRSREEYWKADARVEAYRALLDSLTAEHFGVEDASHFIDYGMDIDLENFEESVEDFPREDQERLARARDAAHERRFFHWEVEFPEVFFDRNRGSVEVRHNGGFDVAMGNPPWGARLTAAEEDYVRRSFESANSTRDSFALLTERSLTMLRKGGELGYIVPSGWQTGKSYTHFRDYILKIAALRRIVNLPYDVFPDAYVDSTVLTARKERTFDESGGIITGPVKYITYEPREKVMEIRENDARFQTVQYGRWFSDHLDPAQEHAFLSALNGKELDVAQKMAQVSVPFGDIADIQRGITPFHLSDRKVDETYHLALDGELRRYYYRFSGTKYVKYDESLAEYKPPRYFRGRRIILRELISRQFQLQAVLVEEDFVTNKSHQSILTRESEYGAGYCLALVNSNLLCHYHIQGSAGRAGMIFPRSSLTKPETSPSAASHSTPPRKTDAGSASRESSYATGSPNRPLPSRSSTLCRINWTARPDTRTPCTMCWPTSAGRLCNSTNAGRTCGTISGRPSSTAGSIPTTCPACRSPRASATTSRTPAPNHPPPPNSAACAPTPTRPRRPSAAGSGNCMRRRPTTTPSRTSPGWVTSVSSGWPPSAAPTRPSWTTPTMRYPRTSMPFRMSSNA